MALAPGVRLGVYEVRELIGAGGIDVYPSTRATTFRSMSGTTGPATLTR
jgi:hypothetical protein